MQACCSHGRVRVRLRLRLRLRVGGRVRARVRVRVRAHTVAPLALRRRPKGVAVLLPLSTTP